MELGTNRSPIAVQGYLLSKLKNIMSGNVLESNFFLIVASD